MVLCRFMYIRVFSFFNNFIIKFMKFVRFINYLVLRGYGCIGCNYFFFDKII